MTNRSAEEIVPKLYRLEIPLLKAPSKPSTHMSLKAGTPSGGGLRPAAEGVQGCNAKRP